MRHPHNRLRFLTNIPKPKMGAKYIRMAHTKFKVIKRMSGITMLFATLYTGRTHQIRAHLSDMGHPIVGDKLYGGNKPFSDHLPLEIKNNLAQLKGQALHAEILEFDHPITKQKMSFSSQEEWLLSLLKYL
jgi:23S rRNA pseudouridine1911/1915/1917 synthase